MIATDVYRPAAIDQLVSLGARIGVPVFEMGTDAKPADIARKGVEQARRVRNKASRGEGSYPKPHTFTINLTISCTIPVTLSLCCLICRTRTLEICSSRRSSNKSSHLICSKKAPTPIFSHCRAPLTLDCASCSGWGGSNHRGHGRSTAD